ncbi:hypothetical protein C8Q76DRAFT_244152 [Earliella scabrosa]|nr:hypothetical protein C8Q76DRAFT_244152 [Earliella scabrosa]
MVVSHWLELAIERGEGMKECFMAPVSGSSEPLPSTDHKSLPIVQNASTPRHSYIARGSIRRVLPAGVIGPSTLCGLGASPFVFPVVNDSSSHGLIISHIGHAMAQPCACIKYDSMRERTRPPSSFEFPSHVSQTSVTTCPTSDLVIAGHSTPSDRCAATARDDPSGCDSYHRGSQHPSPDVLVPNYRDHLVANWRSGHLHPPPWHVRVSFPGCMLAVATTGAISEDVFPPVALQHRCSCYRLLGEHGVTLNRPRTTFTMTVVRSASISTSSTVKLRDDMRTSPELGTLPRRLLTHIARDWRRSSNQQMYMWAAWDVPKQSRDVP